MNMKTLFGYIKILAVFGILAYAAGTAYIINNDKGAFDTYRTYVCLKGLTLQDSYDAVRNGEANTHTKIDYGIKPYITYLYDMKIKGTN